MQVAGKEQAGRKAHTDKTQEEQQQNKEGRREGT